MPGPQTPLGQAIEDIQKALAEAVSPPPDASGAEISISAAAVRWSGVRITEGIGLIPLMMFCPCGTLQYSLRMKQAVGHGMSQQTSDAITQAVGARLGLPRERRFVVPCPEPKAPCGSGSAEASVPLEVTGALKGARVKFVLEFLLSFTADLWMPAGLEPSDAYKSVARFARMLKWASATTVGDNPNVLPVLLEQCECGWVNVWAELVKVSGPLVVIGEKAVAEAIAGLNGSYAWPKECPALPTVPCAEDEIVFDLTLVLKTGIPSTIRIKITVRWNLSNLDWGSILVRRIHDTLLRGGAFDDPSEDAVPPSGPGPGGKRIYTHPRQPHGADRAGPRVMPARPVPRGRWADEGLSDSDATDGCPTCSLQRAIPVRDSNVQPAHGRSLGTGGITQAPVGGCRCS